MTEPREQRLPWSPGGIASGFQSPAPARHDSFRYRIIDTPLGDLLLARTAAGLVRVVFAREGFARVVEDLSDLFHPRPQPAHSSLDDAVRAIEAYFAGSAAAFPLELDLRLITGFQRDVLAHLPTIAYGATQSYAAVATALGRVGAAQAVGVACRANPLPIVLPCHRAVRSDGSIGGYVGGTEAKRVLLALEAV